MAIYAMTGGATGIGAALKELLREAGHQLIVVDIKDADIVADLATEEGRRAAVEGIRAAAPEGLDGFIPCAGLGPHVTPHALIARVNYFAVVHMVEALRELVAARRGTVLLVSSNSAPMADNDHPFVQACLAGDEAHAVADIADGQTAYGGGKRALTLWMRRHCAEYARGGVRMNAVAPGITATPLTEAGEKDATYGDAIRQFADMTPMGGAATPEQIARPMQFLLSPAADFICGSVLFVDGGADALLRPDAF